MKCIVCFGGFFSLGLIDWFFILVGFLGAVLFKLYVVNVGVRVFIDELLIVICFGVEGDVICLDFLLLERFFFFLLRIEYVRFFWGIVFKWIEDKLFGFIFVEGMLNFVF